MNNELISRLHSVDYQITKKEIDDLRKLCYENSCSYTPFDSFFNDVERIKDPNYNRNQAYKDLYLIVLHFVYYYELSIKENNNERTR